MRKLLLATAAIATMGMGANAYADGHAATDGAKAHSEKHMDGNHDTKKAELDIVDTAAENADFSTFVAAVKAADLEGALKGSGPFTVFAPTNEAFAKLPAGTVDDLLKPENKEKLQALLKYHVISGKILEGEVAKGSTNFKTLQGETVNVLRIATGSTVNGVKVINTDIKTSNGIIRPIDGVIMPK